MMTWLRAAFVVLAIVVTAFGYVMLRNVIAPPTPFVFRSTSLVPHEVAAGGHLTLVATGDMRAERRCASGARRVLRFSDRSEATVPGERRVIGHGRVTIFYDMELPTNAPSGPAALTVIEIFTCGVRTEVASPPVRFMVRGAVEPGVDRFYNTPRED